MLPILLLLLIPSATLVAIVVRLADHSIDGASSNDWGTGLRGGLTAMLSRDSYSPAGQRLLTWYWVALAALIVCALFALALLGRRGLL